MIWIDFNNSKPIYRQIADQILWKIKNKELHPGDKLPTERELADQLQVARGTVKKAYKELAANNIIEVIQGSGSYIYNDKEVYDVERRKLILQMIDSLLDQAHAFNMSDKEVAALFRMSMFKKDPSNRLVRIAVIDCNPESLALFKKQLSYIPGIIISLILVDSIILDDDPKQLLSDFDLVVTTVTHYEQVSQSLKGFERKILPVDMAPSRQTIVSISTLPEEYKVGIICQSNKFAYLIMEQLELLCGYPRNVPVHFENDLSGSIKFMKRMDAVIVSPDLLLLDANLSGSAVEDYISAGGKVIPFDYLIDRASLIHLEEHVDSLLRSK